MNRLKHFVLDTNVLLHNPDSINSFGNNYVVLPMTVIEELDNFKRNNDELGRNARHVIRQLDRLRTKGTLKNGVIMDNGGVIKITVEERNFQNAYMDMSVPDNRILAIAKILQDQNEHVILFPKTSIPASKQMRWDWRSWILKKKNTILIPSTQAIRK